MQKAILLIGGTGFIGSQILKQLQETASYSQGSEKEREIIVFTSQSPKNRLENKKIRFIQVDLLNFAETKATLAELKKENLSLETIIQSCQFVNHPLERPWLAEKYSYLGFEPILTSNIIYSLELLGLLDNLNQYIYLSGLGVNEPENQRYPWNKAKLFCEELIKKQNKSSSKFKYTIFRPSWVYGSKDRAMRKFVFLIKLLRIFPMFGSGENKVNPLWVEDLAKIVARSVQEPEAFNQIFEVGSSQLSMNEVVKTIFETLEKRPLIIPQPKFLLKLVAALLQFLPFAPLSPGLIEFVTMKSDLQKPAKELFGQKIHTLRAGLLKSKILF